MGRRRPAVAGDRPDRATRERPRHDRSARSRPGSASPLWPLAAGARRGADAPPPNVVLILRRRPRLGRRRVQRPDGVGDARTSTAWRRRGRSSSAGTPPPSSAPRAGRRCSPASPRSTAASAGTTTTCRPREVTLAEALKARGYATALFGKWHHGTPRGGANDVRPPDGPGVRRVLRVHRRHARLGEVPREALGRPRAQARLGLRRRPVHRPRRRLPRSGTSDGPFFLYVPYIATHFNIEAPPTRSRCTGASSPRPTRPARSTPPTRRWSPGSTATSAGSSTALDDLKLADDTLVIFTSDHGATFESGQPGDEQLPRQQPPVPGPEADPLGGRHPRARPSSAGRATSRPGSSPTRSSR